MRVYPGEFLQIIFFCPLPCLPHSFSYPIFSNFFFFLHHKRFKGLDTCQDYFLHEILTRSLSSFLRHSCKNCALRTLCPVSGLPEIMPFPYYLYRRLTSCRQSALSIIRVANPDVHIIAMVKGREPFFVKTVLNKKNPRSGCRQLMFCEVLCSC